MKHVLVIPNYLPPTANALFRKKRRQRVKLEDECKAFVALYGAHIPKASGKRLVAMAVTLEKSKRWPDADETCYKAVLDALVWHQKLRGDSRVWCEVTPTTFARGEVRETVITLEDVDDADDAAGGAQAGALRDTGARHPDQLAGGLHVRAGG